MFNFFKTKDNSNKLNELSLNEYRLSDIPNYLLNLQQLKKQIEIAVIDDQEFSQAKLLSNNDFKIEELGDIPNIKTVQAYPIVICDIHGVGTKLDSSGLGGAFLISEIRKNYPDKYIIAYSTHSNTLSVQKHIKYADHVMPVPSSTEQWTEALEQALKNVANPIARWKKFRNFLLENDVELIEILQLEQSYIRYLLNQNYNIEDIQNITSKLSISNDLKDIVKQFTVSSVIELAKNLIIGS